jgi:hypothetical protein
MQLDVGILVVAPVCLETPRRSGLSGRRRCSATGGGARASRCEGAPSKRCGRRLVESVQLNVLKIQVALMCSGGDPGQRIGDGIRFRRLLQVAGGSDAAGVRG